MSPLSDRRLRELVGEHSGFQTDTHINRWRLGQMAGEILKLRKQLKEMSNNIPEKELQKVFKK